MCTLSVASLNIRGLNNPVKQDYLRVVIQNTKCDILLLQETKLSTVHLVECLRKRYGRAFDIFSTTPTQNNSAGVITMIRRNAGSTHIQTREVITHRCLISTIQTQNTVWQVLNIYSPPAPGPRALFFNRLHEILLPTQGSMVLAGDFNCVEDHTNDRLSITGRTYSSGDACDLRTLVTDLDLCDLGKRDCSTGSFTHYSRTSAARLDRIYVTSDIQPHFSSPRRFPCPFSDHWVITSTFSPASAQTASSVCWKFNKKLLTDESWVQLITDEIKLLPTDSPASLISSWDQFKLRVRYLAIHRGLELAREKREKEVTLTNEYVRLSREIDSGHDRWSELTVVQDQLRGLQEEAMRGAAIRARIDWINNQERPCRRFFSLEKEHSRRKTIGSLRVDNVITHDQARIKEAVTDHYTRIYQHVDTKREDYQALAKHMKRLDDNALSSLNCELTPQEVQCALLSLPLNKAPGPDGLTAEFYRFFWEHLRPILVVLFGEIIHRKKLPVSQRKGLITLIPKSSDSEALQSLDGWRPITLLNTDYKLYTKVLANRLKSQLEDVIGHGQKCAIPGRKITDLTQLYTLLYETSCSTGPPLMMLQIDQKAAFDYVNHRYMFQVLREMGINGPFLDAILACYYGCTAQVLVNGDLTDEIGLYRGVRQGCPLSMLLYIIQLEPVLQWISKESRIRGVRIGDVEVKYGAFADDVTIFLSSKSSMRYLMAIWDFFTTATGSIFNREKTCGLWIGSWSEKPTSWYGLLWKEDGVRTLGVWIGNAQVRKRNWETIPDAIQKQIAHWKGRQLSLYGRCVAWNVYILSKYHYRAAAAPIPAHICRKIDRLGALFLWSKKYEPTRRSALFFPREEGGLGARSFLWSITALRLQFYYEILRSTPGPLRALLSIWFQVPATHSDPPAGSTFTGRPTRALPFVKSVQCAVNAHHLDIDASLEPAERTFRHIYSRLVITQNPPPKLVIWHGASRAQRLHSMIFRLHALPAVKDLLYHITSDTLPTGHWLDRKGMMTNISDPRCVTCKMTEDYDHVFLRCRRSALFWGRVAWDDIVPPENMADFIDGLLALPPTHLMFLGCAFLALWRERNQVTFRDSAVDSCPPALCTYISLKRYHEQLQDTNFTC